jgi:hypothetical protein
VKCRWSEADVKAGGPMVKTRCSGRNRQEIRQSGGESHVVKQGKASCQAGKGRQLK